MLSELNPVARYLMIGKLVAVLLLIGWAVRINDLRGHWKSVADARQAQLVSLEKQSKESQSKVETRIVEGKTRTVYVDRVAKQIEEAPLPGGCRTPDAIKGADL